MNTNNPAGGGEASPESAGKFSAFTQTPGSASVQQTLDLLDAYIAHRAVKTETDAEHEEWLNHAVSLWQQIVASRAASG